MVVCDLENDSYRLTHCYTGLLANRYNLAQENLAFPGFSLQAMQWNLMWWLNNHTEDYIQNSIIIVGLTEESRVSWYNPNHVSEGDDPKWNRHIHATWLKSSGPNVDTGWRELHKHHLNMTDCDELYQLNYETTVRLFDGISSRYNIPVVQFNAMATTTTTTPCTTLYEYDSRHMLTSATDVYKPMGHPNEKGHKLIANDLISVIDTLIK
jgi:hypothetical protein